MNADHVQIVIAVVQAIGSGGIGVGMIKIVQTFIHNRNQRAANEAYLQAAMIYDELSALRETIDADRILLMFTANGGGIPHPAKPLYTSILYEVKREGLKAIKRDWQRQLLDEGYVNLLRSLINESRWSGSPAEMKDGFLKDVYVVEQVKFAYFMILTRTEKEVFYLAIRWHDELTIPSTLELNAALTPVVTKVVAGLGGKPEVIVQI